MLIHTINRVRLDSCLVKQVIFQPLDSDNIESNDEDYLFVVPTSRETRAGGRKSPPRRCPRNAWDLCRSSPRRRSPLASIDPHYFTVWGCNRTIFFTFSVGRFAERDQEDTPVEQVPPARSVLGQSDAVFQASESVPHGFRSSPSGPAWIFPAPIP